MTVLAEEICAGCGAPLGADQRYCLSCGIPRTGARLPFLDVLHSEAAATGAIERNSQPVELLRMAPLAAAGNHGRWGGSPGISAKLSASMGLFTLIGVLLLTLLIGLLLGHWVSGGAKSVASVPATQVIEVKGLSLPAAATAAPPSASTGVSSAGGTTAEPTTPAPAGESTHTTHASNPTVSSLAKTTGKEHAKAVEKALSKGGGSLSTGGAPPPKETSKSGASKPIGGGSEVTSIE
jgi:hypothetical protein